MENPIRKSVSGIRLSEESKRRMLSQIKKEAESGANKKNIIRFTAIAAAICVLMAGGIIAAVLIDNTDSGKNIEIKEAGIYGRETKGTDEGTDEVTQKPESTPGYQTSSADTEDAPYTSETGEILSNGIYYEKELYEKLRGEFSEKKTEMVISCHEGEAMYLFSFEGKSYYDIEAQLIKDELEIKRLYNVKNMLTQESSSAQDGQADAEYDPYGQPVDELLKKYRKADGKADIQQLENDIAQTEKKMQTDSEYCAKAQNAFFLDFAEKAQQDLKNCGIKDTEIINNYCHITASGKEMEKINVKRKNMYYIEQYDPQMPQSYNDGDTVIAE